VYPATPALDSPDPDPAPFTTIGWRLVHLADCKVMYHEWGFGWTNWGERPPAWRILWTMIDHDAHHGAEIGCLRDLYRATGAGG
jgi:hypothetical protein